MLTRSSFYQTDPLRRPLQVKSSVTHSALLSGGRLFLLLSMAGLGIAITSNVQAQSGTERGSARSFVEVENDNSSVWSVPSTQHSGTSVGSFSSEGSGGGNVRSVSTFSTISDIGSFSIHGSDSSSSLNGGLIFSPTLGLMPQLEFSRPNSTVSKSEQSSTKKNKSNHSASASSHHAGVSSIHSKTGNKIDNKKLQDKMRPVQERNEYSLTEERLARHNEADHTADNNRIENWRGTVVETTGSNDSLACFETESIHARDHDEMSDTSSFTSLSDDYRGNDRNSVISVSNQRAEAAAGMPFKFPSPNSEEGSHDSSESEFDDRLASAEAAVLDANKQLAQMNGAMANVVSYDSDRRDSITLGADGNPVRMSNVAPGAISPTSTDAVNGAQLFQGLAEARGYTDQRFAETQQHIKQVARNAYGGIAATMAMPNQTPRENGNTVVAIGAANFRGQNALGFGVTHRSRCGQFLLHGAASTAGAAGMGVRVHAGYEF